MTTSLMTRKYWVELSKAWAIPRLGHPDYDNESPQLDEYRAVMDDLIADSEELAKLKSSMRQVDHGQVLIDRAELAVLQSAKREMDMLGEALRGMDHAE